jgi:hypothetical protein
MLSVVSRVERMVEGLWIFKNPRRYPVCKKNSGLCDTGRLTLKESVIAFHLVLRSFVLLDLLIFRAYRRVPCGKPPIHVQSIAWIASP